VVFLSSDIPTPVSRNFLNADTIPVLETGTGTTKNPDKPPESNITPRK